ncbi:hypothetical protein B0920_08570 [Massilia sp. KIM]|uniref:hypothetical protein n=1 Tax=Massilia sp. KIM TaxID=1955422 RepID=UPI00098F311F|nr:hypothetical protein [Massilia sp. KIM]OON63419.1 hypothetical protein B0920_08570 [Massilia sp. KIM]
MRAVSSFLIGATLCCGMAAAAEPSPPSSPDTIHVSAMRDPEVRKYQAILAGLDAFDRHHALAPQVDALRFRVERTARATGDGPLAARLEGEDGFLLPLAIDAAGLLEVPRSEAALAADSELLLNQKRRHYRIEPHVRTPGLPAHVRRLGDLRLECKVKVAIAKEEIGLLKTLTVNALLRTTDWCGFFNDRQRGFWFSTQLPASAAVLKEGERSEPLQSSARGFRIPLHEGDWSDEALVELTPAETPTGTAGETPRTAP